MPRNQYWSVPTGFDLLSEPQQRDITYAMNAGGPRTTGLTDAARLYIEALHHHGRTGTKRQNIFFQRDWDVLMNGRPHLVDLQQDMWVGTEAAFRTKVYREAAARCLDVKTKVKAPGRLVIQALELPDPAQREQPNFQVNAPWYRSMATWEELQIALLPPLPDPEPAVAPAAPVPVAAPWSEVEDLGPCSCGADSSGVDMPHAPSCSIW